MVDGICMVDIIGAGITTTMVTDTDLDTIITMGTDILMDVVTEHSPDVMGIIRTRASTITVIDIIRLITDTIRTVSIIRITETIKTLDITKIILRIIGLMQIAETQQIPEREVVTTIELPDRVRVQEHTDKVFHLSLMMRGRSFKC